MSAVLSYFHRSCRKGRGRGKGVGYLKSQGPGSRCLINGIGIFSFVLLNVHCRVWMESVELSRVGWNTTAQKGEQVRVWRSRAVIELLLVASVALVVIGAHLRGIVAVSLEVVAEPGILEGNGVLRKDEHINKVLYLQQFIPD